MSAGAVRPVRGLAIVPLADLHPSPNNPRESMTDIDGLAQSMRDTGLIQPIIAQKIPGRDGFQIVAGHRRHAAAVKLGWVEVPCIIRRDMLPDEELLAMLAENGQPAGLDPIEEARALNRLKTQTGLRDSELAVKVGYSQAKVSGRLALLALTPEEQEQVRAGATTIQVATDHARQVSGRVRPGAKGKKPAAHLASHHPLAGRAANACRQLNHKKGQGAGVGGVACGVCWETVIRADERERLHTESTRRDRCVLCDTVHTPTAADQAVNA